MNRVDARLNKLSDICSDIAQIAMVSIVLPFAIDKSNLEMVLYGLVTALFG